MCGKFTFMATWAEVVDFSQPLTARASNAPEEAATPMRFAPVMHLDANNNRASSQMRWAFTKLVHNREAPDHIHARDDKLLVSPLGRPNVEARRGVLIVSSFNEGEEVPTYKPDRTTPTGNTRTVQWTIRPKDGSRLAIAIIYRDHQSAEGPVREFVMCTTKANEGVARFVVAGPDQRMPAVLHEDDIPVGLGETNAPIETIVAALKTYEDHGTWDMRPSGRRNTKTSPDQSSLF